MADKRTRVILEAQARGFDQAGKEARKVTDALKAPKDAEKNFTALDKAVARSAHQFARISKAVGDLNKLLKATDGAGSMSKLRSELDKVIDKVDKLSEKRRRSHEDEEERSRRRERRMSFQRGVAQGLGVGEYFPERDAPGFYRNLAGRAVGRTAGAAGSLAMTPFTGAQGFATGLGGIPGIGPFLAGQFQTGMAAAQQAAAVQQARHAFAPFTSVSGESGRISRARSRAAAGVHVPAVDEKLAAVEAESARGIALAKPGDPMQRDFEAGFAVEAARKGSLARQSKARSAAIRRKDAAADRAEAAIRRESFDFMRTAGVDFGMTEADTLGAASQFYGASGRTGDRDLKTSSGKRALRAALGAQSKFGIGMDVSGAFSRASGSGAFGRAGVDPTQALTQSVQDGLRLGLSGTDLQRYVADMASRLQAFETDGIPLARDSLVGIQSGLASILGGGRANAIAGGLVNTAQSISMSGPQDAAQFLMLREMGGFHGGGIKQYVQALRKMEAGGDPGGFSRLLQSVQTTGSEEGNSLSVQMLLGKLGQRVGIGTSDALTGNGNAAMQEVFRKNIAQGTADADVVGKRGLDALGKGATSASERALAGVQNQTAGAGERLLTSMINLEKTSANLVTNFSELSRHVESLSEYARDGSKKLNGLFKEASDLMTQAKQMMAR